MTEWGLREPDGNIVTDKDWRSPADVMRAAGTFEHMRPGPVQVVYREWSTLDDPNRRIKFQALPEFGDATLPVRGYPGDAGLDLFVADSVHVYPGRFVDVPCGVAVDLPAGFWGRITGRSSTLRKRGLLVSEGIIDNGYTGPLFAGVWNLTNQPVVVHRGDRIAQLIIQRIESWQPVWGEVEPKDRGVNGFGSTGA